MTYWKPEKEKSEIRQLGFDKIANCDSVYVETAEIKRLLPGYFEINKHQDVWPVDFQDPVKEEEKEEVLRSISDKTLVKRGVIPPKPHRIRPWLGLGKRPPYLLWNKFERDF